VVVSYTVYAFLDFVDKRLAQLVNLLSCKHKQKERKM